MNLGPSTRIKTLLNAIQDYITTVIIPAEHDFFVEVPKGDRWQLNQRQVEILERLKQAAREQGWWNFFLTEHPAGYGLNTVEYAYLAEAMGHSHLAAEVFNCNAPDTGNMEVLARFGSQEQQRQWLQPLLDGQIRSAYAMTEPDVACSDAANVSMQAVLQDGHWVLNGEKTYITGAGDPRCAVLICMVKTDPEAERHKQHSQLLVPMPTPGLEIVRPMQVFAADDAPHGHMHLRFDNVRVPEDAIILGRGRGFEISQGRLGPGRVHHCMRAIGMAEQALQLMCQRALSRRAFGKPLAKLGGNYERIAQARMQIEMARLLTLKTAYIIDTEGVSYAQPWISMIKTIVPNVTLAIIDDAIQLHGAAGVSQDFPLAAMYTAARTLRLADGPDEVHRMVVARNELAAYLKPA